MHILIKVTHLWKYGLKIFENLIIHAWKSDFIKINTFLKIFPHHWKLIYVLHGWKCGFMKMYTWLKSSHTFKNVDLEKINMCLTWLKMWTKSEYIISTYELEKSMHADLWKKSYMIEILSTSLKMWT